MKELNKMDPKFKKWIKWLSVIEEEISELTIGKHIYWQIWQILKTNETTRKNLLLFHYLNNSYVSYAVMGIRRQVKIDKQSISLLHLLEEIKIYPKLISRKYFVSLYKHKNTGQEQFNAFSRSKYIHIDPDLVREDIKELKKYSNNSEILADKRLAHRDKRNVSVLPKFAELEDCLETLEILARKYHFIFHAQHLDILPDYNKPDLNQILYESWLVPNQTK